jgi:UDP-N-acetylglucosamine 4,6-dehydratase
MLKDSQIKDLFEDKRVLITGGLGSIGSEIAKQLLNYDPKEIRILDDRETGLFYTMAKYSSYDNVKFYFGDIRENERLSQIMERVDAVFHTAAVKHVTICEYNPFEAVKTNVIGTQNVIECVLKHNVERMMLISTDKAVNPTNVLGATKLLAERLVSATYYRSNENTTKFGVVRFGNVLASRGSVLKIWENHLKEGRKIAITNPNMTRFFMSIPESVRLIFSSAQYAENGEIFILKMPSVRIGDLAKAFLELKGYSTNHCEIIGARVGEKMHEELISENETGLLLENEELLVRLPLIFVGQEQFYESREYKRLIELGFKKSNVKEFLSNDKNCLLNKEKVKKILKGEIE